MANLPIKGKNIYLKSINYRLLKQVTSEVDSRLNTSLYNQVFIVLDKNKNPGQVEQFGEMIHKVGSELKSRLKHKEITTVFDQPDVNGRLLILGEPGSGKTTILLKLAEELVKRAEDDNNHPIPVLFSLSSWKKDNQNIKDWLVEQLKDKYGVRKDIGKKLVDNQEIIPLLDGLDEIAAERQELCVRKINSFLHISNWNNPLVVCSRIEEYQHYTTLLQLNNSLELCTLTSQQVYQYLQNTDNLQLWDSIHNNEDLNELAQTPLLLNIIVLSAQEISIETWQKFETSKERYFYLFEAYIHKMLKRPYKGKQPQIKNTQRWLNWLALRLAEENTVEFFIEKIQPYFLSSKVKRVVYHMVVWGIISALINGLFFKLLPGLVSVLVLVFGLVFGLVSGLINGLIGELIENKIEKTIILIAPLLSSSAVVMKWMILGLVLGLVSGLVSDFVSGLINEPSYFLKIDGELIYRLLIWVLFWPFYGLINGLIFGLIVDNIKKIASLKFNLKKNFLG